MCNLRRDPLQGKMLEADFAADTITFTMQGDYFAAAGVYIILPIAEYEDLKRNQKEFDPMRDMMRRQDA